MKISRRTFTKTITTGMGSAVLNPAAIPAMSVLNSPVKKRPNIVFICSDQHTFRCTGYYHHPVVKTPNLDRIAKKGIVFSNTYTGSPVSVPGRTSMMTGVLASDCNSFSNSTVWDGSHPIWGTLLNEEGYYCRAIGKMDLNDAYHTGFDEIKTTHEHAINPDITSLFRAPVAYRMSSREQIDGKPRETRHNDSAKTDLALKFLKEESSGIKKPWAIFLGLTEPHPPYVALKKYYEMYPEYNIDMPNIPPGHLEELHLGFQVLRQASMLATQIPEDRIRRARAGYYGMITELDEYVGQVWDQLEHSGELENTLFIYTSDHGESLGEHGLWHKNNLYEQSAHIPLIIAGVGLPQDNVINTPVAHIDIVATMLDLAGSDNLKKLRGSSLLPLILGKQSHPGFAYCESNSEGNCTGSYMIRKGNWKYIHFSFYDHLLFNLEKDPGEFNNLINKPETAEIQKELRDILYSIVDPEEITVRSFRLHEKILADFARNMTEDQLFDMLISRLGPGQARIFAKKCKGF